MSRLKTPYGDTQQGSCGKRLCGSQSCQFRRIPRTHWFLARKNHDVAIMGRLVGVDFTAQEDSRGNIRRSVSIRRIVKEIRFAPRFIISAYFERAGTVPNPSTMKRVMNFTGPGKSELKGKKIQADEICVQFLSPIEGQQFRATIAQSIWCDYA